MKKLLQDNEEIINVLKKKSLIDTKYPHISHEICIYWGTETFYDYMHETMFSLRSGLRDGFPLDVWSEM